MKAFAKSAVAVIVLTAAVAAQADGYRHHRAAQRNEWNNLAIGSAAIGILGLLSHNNTLGLLGLGGAAYSGYRANQERDRGWSSYRYQGNKYQRGYSDNSYQRSDNRRSSYRR